MAIKQITIAALLAVSSISAQAAGAPQCAGSYEPAKCEARYAAINGETPEQSAARLKKIEAQIAKSQKAMAKMKKVKEGVRIGDTCESVLNSSWGKPERVNTTTTQYGQRQQWAYGIGNYLFFEDCILTSIHH